LRYPTAGENFPHRHPAYGLGKPVILTAGCETSRFRFNLISVRRRPGEEEMLAEYIGLAGALPCDARAIGERAVSTSANFTIRQKWELCTGKRIIKVNATPFFACRRFTQV